MSVFVVSVGGGAGGGAADTALKTNKPHDNVGKNKLSEMSRSARASHRMRQKRSQKIVKKKHSKKSV